jgi:flagellar biosynthesis/type III secretory pathway protein FliH
VNTNDRHLPEPDEELATMEEQAREQGWRDGYAEGYARGFQDGQRAASTNRANYTLPGGVS